MIESQTSDTSIGPICRTLLISITHRKVPDKWYMVFSLLPVNSFAKLTVPSVQREEVFDCRIDFVDFI